MSVAVLLVVSLGLAFHIFEITMEIGATQSNWGRNQTVKMGLLFAGIQFLMVSGGISLTYLMERVLTVSPVSKVYRYITVLFLVVIALREYENGAGEDTFLERREEPLSWGTCVRNALRTGCEAVVMGICFYYVNNTLYGGLCILAFALAGGVGGFFYGYWWGIKSRKKVCITDAVLMTLMAFRLIVL